MSVQAVKAGKKVDPVQFVLDLLSSREAPSSTAGSEELLMGNVLQLALAVGCSEEFMGDVVKELKDQQVEIVSVKDEVLDEVVEYLNTAESTVADSFREEVQVTVNLAQAIGLSRGAQWMTNVFGPRFKQPIETPLAIS